jgi:hypothetical protein
MEGIEMTLRAGVAFALLACCAALVGCGSDGPDRHRLSGEAEFDGRPIPYGDVLFTPDGAKGNKGPQGIAMIRNGKYDTAAAGGKGIAGGPTVIRVTGFDAEGGKLICEYEWSVELPRGDGTFKIEVPAQGAPGNRKPKGDDI